MTADIRWAARASSLTLRGSVPETVRPRTGPGRPGLAAPPRPSALAVRSAVSKWFSQASHGLIVSLSVRKTLSPSEIKNPSFSIHAILHFGML